MKKYILIIVSIILLACFFLILRSNEDWKTVLINENNPVPDNHKIKVVKLENVEVDKRIVGPLKKLLKQGRKENIKLKLDEGYRSKELQQKQREENISRLMSEEGMTAEQALIETNKYFAEVGKSEHQLGLAVDVVSEDFPYQEEAFADTDAGKWLADHGHEFGFIIRYPKDKVDITGKEYEPWHLRYVGKKVAKEIKDRGICLEEFIECNKK